MTDYLPAKCVLFNEYSCEPAWIIRGMPRPIKSDSPLFQAFLLARTLLTFEPNLVASGGNGHLKHPLKSFFFPTSNTTSSNWIYTQQSDFSIFFFLKHGLESYLKKYQPKTLKKLAGRGNDFNIKQDMWFFLQSILLQSKPKCSTELLTSLRYEQISTALANRNASGEDLTHVWRSSNLNQSGKAISIQPGCNSKLQKLALKLKLGSVLFEKFKIAQILHLAIGLLRWLKGPDSKKDVKAYIYRNHFIAFDGFEHIPISIEDLVN